MRSVGRARSAQGTYAFARGFTIIELVTVMILVGILAVVALPRMFDRGDFDAMGFRDGTVALLHYAQKSAIAQRRTVCVRFSANQSWLTMRQAADDVTCGVHAAPGNVAPAGEVLLTGPNGHTPFAVPDVAGPASYAPTPANFYFTASGAPSAGGTVTVASSGTITVEAETGYVH